MVNELATLGDDPNTFNEFGEAPLCVAAYKAQGMVVEELLQRENIKVGRRNIVEPVYRVVSGEYQGEARENPPVPGS